MHVDSIDGKIQTWRMYYKYSSFRIWIFMMKQETFSKLNLHECMARERRCCSYLA